MRILLITLLLAFNGFAQHQNWPPQGYKPKAQEPENQEIYLEWADSLLPQIATIEFVKLQLQCDDGTIRKQYGDGPKLSDREIKKIKRKVKRESKRKYYEPVRCMATPVLVPDSIRMDTTFIDSTTIHLTRVPVGTRISLERLYDWTKADTSDFQTIFESALGLRRSQWHTMCYNPRHAIVYKNVNDSILGINEICFECGQTVIFFNNQVWLDFAPQDQKTLKELFVRYGLIIEEEEE